MDKLRLESPYEWGMEENVKKIITNHESDEIYYDQDEIMPVYAIMKIIVEMYKSILLNEQEDVKVLLEKLKGVKALLTKQKVEDEGLSRRVINHVISASEYRTLKELGQNVDHFEGNIESLDNLDDCEKGTLNALKSLSFAVLNLRGCEKAKEFAENAFKTITKCPTLFFFYGLTRRRMRRRESFLTIEKPELLAFEKAYELSKEPSFALRLAHCYYESRMNADSQRIYQEIFDSNPQNACTQLGLALAFINMQQYENAEKCLAYVEMHAPERTSFLRYKGLYLMKSGKDLKEAAHILKKAVDKGSYGAALNYIQCQEKIDEEYNAVDLLDEMLSMEINEASRKQGLLLHKAMYLYKKYRDYDAAVQLFAEAIDVDPDSKLLRKYRYSLIFPCSVHDVYTFLRNELLPTVENVRPSLGESTREKIQKLKNHVQIHPQFGNNRVPNSRTQQRGFNINRRGAENWRNRS